MYDNSVYIFCWLSPDNLYCLALKKNQIKDSCILAEHLDYWQLQLAPVTSTVYPTHHSTAFFLSYNLDPNNIIRLHHVSTPALVL